MEMKKEHSGNESSGSPRPALAEGECGHPFVERYVTKGRFAPPAEYWSCATCGASFVPAAILPDGSPFTREQHHELCIGVMAGCYPFVDARQRQAIREGVESAALLGIPVDCRNLEKGGPLFTGGNA